MRAIFPGVMGGVVSGAEAAVLRGRLGGFTPFDLESLVYFWDTEDASKMWKTGSVPAGDGETVVSFTDLKAAQAITATNGPTLDVDGAPNGKRAMAFDGVNDNLFVDATIMPAVSTWMGLVKQISDTSGDRIFDTGAGGGRVVFYQRSTGSNPVALRGANDSLIGMEQYKGKWDVLTVQTDSVNNTLTLWRNGEILANGATSGTLTRARYALGATAANPPVAGFANIALGPHAIFDGILGAADLRKMREWFYARYGRLFLGQIICDGNSLTNGTGGFAYPTILAATFGAGNNLDVLVRNFGVGGQTTRAMLLDVESQVVARYNSERQYNVCVVWEILNDWAVRVGTDGEPARQASDNCVEAIWEYCDIVKAAGFKVVVLTVLPATYSVGQNNTERAHINARLRDEWADHADAIADVAADPNIGPNGAQTNATYYSVDQVHLTETGYGVVSSIVKASIDTFF